MTEQLLDPDYQAGYLAGATWGITHATNQLEQRDEHLARRIVALQYDHEHPLPADIETWIDRSARIWAEAPARQLTNGPVPTYAQCMASWDAA